MVLMVLGEDLPIARCLQTRIDTVNWYYIDIYIDTYLDTVSYCYIYTVYRHSKLVLYRHGV
jgi:hypothetical protein